MSERASGNVAWVDRGDYANEPFQAEPCEEELGQTDRVPEDFDLRYRIQTSQVVSPILSDFGLISLSRFVLSQLQHNAAENRRLRQNPALAAKDRAIQILRRLVNGGKNLVIYISDGRLIVITAVMHSRRCNGLVSAGQTVPQSSQTPNSPVSMGPSKRKTEAETLQSSSIRSRLFGRNLSRGAPPKVDGEDVVQENLPFNVQSDLQPSAQSLSHTEASTPGGDVAGTSRYDLLDHARVMGFEEHTAQQRRNPRQRPPSLPHVQQALEPQQATSDQQARKIFEINQETTAAGGLRSMLFRENQVSSCASDQSSNSAVSTKSSSISSPCSVSSMDDVSGGDFVKESVRQNVGTTATIDPALVGLHISNSSLRSTKHFSGLTDKDNRGVKQVFDDSEECDSIVEDDKIDLGVSSQSATEESRKDPQKDASSLVPERISGRKVNAKDPMLFPYDKVVPEFMPLSISRAKTNCKSIWAAVGMDETGRPNLTESHLWSRTQYTMENLDPRRENILGAPDINGDYPRRFMADKIPKASAAPPECPASRARKTIPAEIWPTVAIFLSSNEVRVLRLVNKAFARDLAPLMLRSSVVNFSREMFSIDNVKTLPRNTSTLPSNSMFNKYGPDINKFAITFEYDLMGLATAPMKATTDLVQAWWGDYIWPKVVYPRFEATEELENLGGVHGSLLTKAIGRLTKVTELGISVDSGHGWLNGPDLSDLALYRQREAHGTKVFGPAFKAKDKLSEYALRQYFKWAQVNTLTACAKYVATLPSPILSEAYNDLMREVEIREYDSYLVQADQPDFSPHHHTGGLAPLPSPAIPPVPTAGLPLPGFPQWVPMTHHNNMPVNQAPQLPLHPAVLNPVPTATQGPGSAVHPGLPFQPPGLQPPVVPYPSDTATSSDQQPREHAKITPQWPIIFNCHNLSAQLGGDSHGVQKNVAHPTNFPIHPRNLSESQAQWLMETYWAQRVFLATLTQSLTTNFGVLKGVHSLHIAKISSGLLSSLERKDFWTCLTGLRNLTLMVIPDWRQAHVPNDSKFGVNMNIGPLEATRKFHDFLQEFIAPIEGLDKLTIGYVGGGEHATGTFARNHHILPAPITKNDVYAWLCDKVKPGADNISVFDHIIELKFVNCWFTPGMLETFLEQSQDTSLHHLLLESVSLTGSPSTLDRLGDNLSVQSDRLKCKYEAGEWLQETIPPSACWADVLDKVTPGQTILDRKYDADMIDEDIQPRPEKVFRGNIQKITLESCGYVQIPGIPEDQFNQSEVVVHHIDSMDRGLDIRRKKFYVNVLTSYAKREAGDEDYVAVPSRTANVNDGNPVLCWQCHGDEPKNSLMKIPIMMDMSFGRSAGSFWGSGSMTSCVHPIEKRILEQAWGMRFGWGDTMDRFAAVEDGYLEGGTGRFSGVISKYD